MLSYLMHNRWLKKILAWTEFNPHLRFAFLTTMFISVGGVLAIIVDILDNSQLNADRNNYFYLMLVVFQWAGAALCVRVLSWLLRHPRKWLMSLYVVFISAFTSGLLYSFLQETSLFSTWVGGAVALFISGIVLTFVFFILLSVSRALIVVIFPLLAILNAMFLHDSSGLLNAFYIVLFVSAAAFIFAYFAHLAKLKKKEYLSVVRSKHALVFAVISILLVLAVNSYLKVLRQMHSDGEKIRQVLVQNENGEQSNDSVLDYDQRVLSLLPRIVGYYKAPKPLYLKTHVFTINQGKKLEVDVLDFPQIYYSNYKDKSEGVKKGEEVKVMFRHLVGQGIPSAERIQEFADKNFSVTTGLLAPRSQYPPKKESTQFMEYTYTQFDPEKDLNRKKNIENTELKDPYSYTTVLATSDRYREVRDLTRKVTAGAKTDYEKAKAVSNYLVENYRYSFMPNIKDQANPMDDFLLDGKRGYCTHFATSMNIMLDTVGVPSRLVGGFYSDTYHEKMDAYLMLSSDLHVWVEVYIQGYGWVPFEATTYKLAPGTPVELLTGANRSLTDFLPPNVDSLLASVDPQMSFDNIFETQITTGLQIAEDGVSIEQVKHEWSPPNNVPVLTPEQQAAAEQARKEREEWNKKLFQMIAILGSIVVVGGLLISLLLYLKWWYVNREALKRQKQRRVTREIDYKIRRYFVKKLSLPESVLRLSQAKFLDHVVGKASEDEYLLYAYHLIDKILYSRGYTDEEFEQLKKIAKQIINTN